MQLPLAIRQELLKQTRLLLQLVKLKKEHTWSYKWSSSAGKRFISVVEKVIAIYVENKSVFPSSQFPGVAFLEANHAHIEREYLRVKSQKVFYDITGVSEEQKKVVNKSEWEFFPFYIYGNKIHDNLQLCPETAKCLASIPNLTTAFFSVIKPQTFIKEHRGAFKGYLRLLFGVKVPKAYTKCGIKIENKVYHWENGKSLVFDDTFLHEAWNYSEEERVVLYVDFIRPMPYFFVTLSKGLTKLISASPYVQNSLKNLRESSKRS
jgi:ornithine lipid ester-linked acyl 2-hydroxylase